MAAVAVNLDQVSIVERGSNLPNSVTLRVELEDRSSQFTIAGIKADNVTLPEEVPDGQPWDVKITTTDGAGLKLTIQALAWSGL